MRVDNVTSMHEESIHQLNKAEVIGKNILLWKEKKLSVELLLCIIEW